MPPDHDHPSRPQQQLDQQQLDQQQLDQLSDAVGGRGPHEAFELLEPLPDEVIAQVLLRENPSIADEILWEFPPQRRAAIQRAAPSGQGEQWSRNHAFPEDSVGRLMDPITGALTPELRVVDAIQRLRPIVKKVLVTYGWVVNAENKLLGVLVFRELLFADPHQSISELMIPNPFTLSPQTPVADAMREVLAWHLPVYPVCDADGRLLGLVRGVSLFEHQAFELSAQAGALVGVEREERLATPWSRSLRFRHPWLQLNLLTAFVAASVVGVFQETLNELVVLAVFLPVLAGQSGNTGCQALAVALRGITLGELHPERAKRVVLKEAWLGLLNGTLVGITAGIGMYVFATSQDNPSALTLACVVMLAMVGSCTISGVAGALVPLTLRRWGADPATASSIFLTTATDVVSMGLFLGLATWLVL